MDISPVLVAVVGLLTLLVLIGLLITTRYRVAGPNEAFIITGRKGKGEVRNPETGEISTDLSGQKVVMGGGVFVVPFVQRQATLDLSSRPWWRSSRRRAARAMLSPPVIVARSTWSAARIVSPGWVSSSGTARTVTSS